MPGLEGMPVVVLAAGRGTRMGGPKALMQVSGRPWWVWQSERIAAAGVEAVWVVSAEVRAGMGAGGPARVVEASSTAPMFESVRAGVASVAGLKPRGVFVLPVDVPAAGATVWGALVGAGEVAAPEYRGEHGHPLWMSWNFVEREVLMAGTGARLDEVIGGRVVYVAVEDGTVTRNLNTPECVREWERG